MRKKGSNVIPEIFQSNAQFGLNDQDKNLELNASWEWMPEQLIDHLGEFRSASNLFGSSIENCLDIV